MRFFRSTWLQRILLFLLLVLLSAGPFGFIEQQGDGKDDHVISSPYCFGKLNGQLLQIQIKYGFDVIHVSLLPIIAEIISGDYIPGTSFDHLSTDFITHPDRGPPRLIAIL
jgi:hypothetical protein